MKKFYLLILLGLGFNNIRSQTFSWAKDEGFYAYDYGLGIVTDNSGNVYVAGKYEQNANFSGTILPCISGTYNCNHDIYVAKYSSTGSLTWIHTGGGNLGDYAHAISSDGNNLFVAGEIEGVNNLITFPGSTITLTSVGDNDIFLSKYDLNGNLLWATSAGGYKNEKALGVSQDAAGNIYICGEYVDSCKFDASTMITGKGVFDAFVAKYNSNGVFQWVRTAGGSGRDEAQGIKCDASGNCYVAGFFSDGAMFVTTTYSTMSSSFYDAFLAKYDTNGNLQWVRTGRGLYDEVGWSVTMDNAGMIYMSGEFNATGYFGSFQIYTNGNADAFVVKYDAAGNEQWAKGVGGPLIDRARGVGTDGSNILITGQFGGTANFGSTALVAADSSDVFFAGLDNSGNFLNALSVGGKPDSPESLGYESGIAITADNSGNVFGTGALLNGGVFGSISVSPYARTDMFLTKITQFVGIHSLSNPTGAIHVYPNPGTGNFNLVLEQPINQKTELTVYNCLGQTIYKKISTSLSKTNIDVSDEEAGVYFIELKTDDKIVMTKKVIIQK